MGTDALSSRVKIKWRKLYIKELDGEEKEKNRQKKRKEDIERYKEKTKLNP
jgi:protein subunit release factor B